MLDETRAQAVSEPYAFKYFFDQPPPRLDRAALPPSATDVFLAKVRIVEGPNYLGGRDQSGIAPPPPKDIFEMKVEILRAMEGRAAPGTQHELRFGVPGTGRRMVYPHTPRQKATEYFIASYLDEDGLRRLVALPVSEQEYNAWEQEMFAYERERWYPAR